MYHDLRELYCGPGLKREVTDVVELVSETEEKVKLIRDRLREASDRQKSYVDLKHQEIEFFCGGLCISQGFSMEKDTEVTEGHYRFDPTHIVPVEEIEVRPDMTFDEEPVQNLDREVKVLRKKSIPLVKVLWRNHNSEEATWEP
ncbi:uncharacterized protein LOC128042512 [Gossypium raimondii]|uniref:uncharacterized protein LOC128042512 n=1 Tax=Gossypium raimondii TaxID=29730 RepID=UPI00227C31CC|nr:uncharacterized protein LOC128042512 [Gossypium raimondii]